MKMIDYPTGRAPGHAPAFTLIELLVVVGMLALLATITLSARSTSTDQQKIAQCASNLRQFTQAMLILGAENNDKLPFNQSAVWPWDIPWSVGDSLTNYCPNWRVLYCPGTAPSFTDTDNFRLFTFAPPSMRVLGYANTLPGSTSLASTNANSTVTPQAVKMGPLVLPAPLASTRVLLADATISLPGQDDYSLRYTYNWTQISGGFGKPHLTPHMAGQIPAGGNLGMLDGHVEWRTFDRMRPRTTGGTSPEFWW